MRWFFVLKHGKGEDKVNILAIAGEINGERVVKVTEEVAKLKEKGFPPVIIWISSGGGIVEAGFDLYDLLRLYPGKKTGIVWKYARSAASFVLQACDERFATPHARIMIHHISRRDLNLDTLRSGLRVKKIVKEMEILQSLMYQIYSRRTNRTIAQIRKECTKEHDMFPEEARAFGLIDGIWDKPLPFNDENTKVT
ncbi:MAG: ATP-dependent Clp protease proteolytic subunit [bacterium]